VGEDFPARHLDFLRRKGIILDSLIRGRGKTFQWSGEYRGDLNSALTLSTELGVLPGFLPAVREREKRIKYLFLANVDPDIQRHLLERMHSPRLVGLDSMNFWIRHKRRSLVGLLKKADIYVANDQEARDLSGETNLIKAAKCLRRLGPRMVVIKKGEHGVLFYTARSPGAGAGFIFSLPAYPTDRVIDPTGAGDTFAGGFMGYLAGSGRLSKAAIKKAVAYGTVAASFNVEGFGLERSGRLTAAELKRRFLIFKKQGAF
jgi:sugar/nucleoside kinase (ribokinase family)